MPPFIIEYTNPHGVVLYLIDVRFEWWAPDRGRAVEFPFEGQAKKYLSERERSFKGHEIIDLQPVLEQLGEAADE